MDEKETLEEQYDRIYRYCYYKLQQRELAEDITQETFLRFYQKESYQGQGEPLRLMYTIAGNLCVDEFRRNRQRVLSLEGDCGGSRQESGAGEEGSWEVPCQAPSPEDEVVSGYWLRQAMEKLDEVSRDIVFLHLVNEEKFVVIAKLLGMSRYAVYRRYESALKLLRKEME